MKCRFIAALMVLAMLTACNSSTEIDLNSLSLGMLIDGARSEGRISSAAMPDDWVNWRDSWAALKSDYSLIHSDLDMSSGEVVDLFSNAGSRSSCDMGDVGLEYAKSAKAQGLTLPYKTSYWYDIPAWAKDDRGDYIAAYTGVTAFLVNKSLVKDTPHSWADIANGSYTVTVGNVLSATQSQCAVLASAFAFGGSLSNLNPAIDFWEGLAKAGRLDRGSNTTARIADGSIEVAILFDFNALAYMYGVQELNLGVQFAVVIPSDGAVRHGYSTIINKHSSHPHAAALAREYILSDAGQLNIARGYARPVRNIELPDDVKAKMLPDEMYANVYDIKRYEISDANHLSSLWRSKVLPLLNQN